MRILMLVVPNVVVLLLTIIAALPLGLEAGARFPLPLLPLLAIAHVSIRRPAEMPAIVVFAAGFLLDMLTHGPLGYWSLVYLAGHVVAGLLGPGEQPSLLTTWAIMLPVLLAAGLAEWLVHSLYFVEPAAALPRLQAVLTMLAAYPLLGLLLLPLEASRPSRRFLRLERGD